MTIRQARPGDEMRLRDLRLQALSEAPLAFGATVATDAARTLDEWRSWIEDGVVFFAEGTDGPVGLAGVRLAPDVPIATIVSVWVHPAHRGSGASGALVAAALSWALDTGRTVRLSCVADNATAIRLYARHGFRLAGAPYLRRRDGVLMIAMEHQPSSAQVAAA